MSLWYSLGLHTVITDKPRVPSQGGLGHVGVNAQSKSYLVISVVFLHHSHHPLLLFYYSTFRFLSFCLAQMSDKACAGEKFNNQSLLFIWTSSGVCDSIHLICSCWFLKVRHIQYQPHDQYPNIDSCVAWRCQTLVQRPVWSSLRGPVYAGLWSSQKVPWESQFRLPICGPTASQGCPTMETIVRFTNAAFIFTAFQGYIWWVRGEAQHHNTTTNKNAAVAAKFRAARWTSSQSGHTKTVIGDQQGASKCCKQISQNFGF